MYKEYEGLIVESIRDGGAKNAKPLESRDVLRPVKVEAHLADGMVANYRMKRGQGKAVDVFISVLGHSVVVAILILLPLYFTHAINLNQCQNTFLAAPPPPPPPPPAAMHVMPRVPKSFFTQAKLFAPKFIPKKVAQVKEEAPLEAPTVSGETGGVPGGVPGGQIVGVLGGILGGNGHAPTPPPPTPVAHKGPYRVGGRVQPPRLVRQVQPIYPALAKQARIQGDVLIDSVIDKEGKITQMKVVSGSPLLVQAAMQALEQWRYQPTLLNGEPVSVDMVVTVHFQLGENS